MGRVILHELERYAFRYDVTVQPRHENSHRHVDHKVFVEMIHDARGNALRHLGLSEQDLGDGRTGDVMGDLAVNYKREAFAFDRLHVDTHFGDFRPKSFRMFFRLRRAADGCVVALAEAGFVCFDYAAGAATRLPEAFLRAVSVEGPQVVVNG